MIRDKRKGKLKKTLEYKYLGFGEIKMCALVYEELKSLVKTKEEVTERYIHSNFQWLMHTLCSHFPMTVIVY